MRHYFCRVEKAAFFADKPHSVDNKTLVTGNFNHIVPSNCQDLKLLGHKLNGFYLIGQPDEKLAKFMTVYCDFTKGNLMNHPGIIIHCIA